MADTQSTIQQAVDPNAASNYLWQQAVGAYNQANTQKRPALPSGAEAQKMLNQEKQWLGQMPTNVPKAPDINTTPPKSPDLPDIQPLQAFSEVAPSLITFASLFTRPSGMAAAKTATAAMEAYKQGKVDDYNRAREKFKDDLEVWKDKLEAEKEKYQMARDEAGDNMKTWENKGTAMAAVLGDQHMMDMFKAGMAGKAMEFSEMKLRNVDQLAGILSKLQKSQATLPGGKVDWQSLSDTDVVPGTGLSYSALKQKVTTLHDTGSYTMAGLPGTRSANNPLRDAADNLRAYMYPDDKQAQSVLDFHRQMREAASTGNLEAKIRPANEMIDQIIPKIEEFRSKVDFRNIRTMNDLDIAVKNQFGDNALQQLHNYVYTLQNDYALLSKRGGESTDAAQARASQTIAERMANDSFAGALESIKGESDIATRVWNNRDKEVSGKQGAEATPQRVEKTINGQKYYQENGKWYAE